MAQYLRGGPMDGTVVSPELAKSLVIRVEKDGIYPCPCEFKPGDLVRPTPRTRGTYLRQQDGHFHWDGWDA